MRPRTAGDTQIEPHSTSVRLELRKLGLQRSRKTTVASSREPSVHMFNGNDDYISNGHAWAHLLQTIHSEFAFANQRLALLSMEWNMQQRSVHHQSTDSVQHTKYVHMYTIFCEGIVRVKLAAAVSDSGDCTLNLLHRRRFRRRR